MPNYNEYRVSFPELKRPGRGVDHPPHLGPISLPVLGWNLTFKLYILIIIIIIIITYLLTYLLSLGGSSPYTSTDKTNKNK